MPFRIVLLGLRWRTARLLAVPLHKSAVVPGTQTPTLWDHTCVSAQWTPRVLPHVLVSGSLRQDVRGTCVESRRRDGGGSCRACLSPLEVAVTSRRIVDRLVWCSKDVQQRGRWGRTAWKLSTAKASSLRSPRPLEGGHCTPGSPAGEAPSCPPAPYVGAA